MRVIPVIDLKSGAAVHAVRGERERYRPLRSRLVAGIASPSRSLAPSAKRSDSTSSTSPISTRSPADRSTAMPSPPWRSRRG